MTIYRTTGNVAIGGTFGSDTGEKLQITGRQINIDTSTYTTGSNNSLVIQKNFTIPSGSTIPSGGQTLSSINSGNIVNFQGSLTIPNSAIFSNTISINVYTINSAGVTITNTPAVGTRTISSNIVQNQFSGTNSGTFSHVSSSQILGYYNNNTGTITPTITNAYQLFINNIDDYSHTFTLTNRWGIYQEGANDRNYFAGNLLLGNTIDTGEKLQVTGNAKITGAFAINSTTEGFLPPRMTSLQRNSIGTLVSGLIVYDTTVNKLYVYTNAWEQITSI